MGNYHLHLNLLLACTLLVFILWKTFLLLIWRPYAIIKHFSKQGIRGPSYFPVLGSLQEIKQLESDAKQTHMDPTSHDVTPKVLSYCHRWSQQYGETFLYWFGTEPWLCVIDPDLIKEVLSTKFGYFTAKEQPPPLFALLGKGMLSLRGADWVRHRRALNPAFHMDKLKGMVTAMGACTSSRLKEWESEIARNSRREFEMHSEFTKLTGDIIAYTSFGTSYQEGKEVFEIQRELHHMVVDTITAVHIPGSESLPTKWNRRIWKLDKQLRSKLKWVIEEKLKAMELKGGWGDDLLGLMLGSSMEGSKREIGSGLTADEIIDECKTFFFACHETITNLLTWAIFYLSSDIEWQRKLRDEVVSICGIVETPDADKLAKLKLVTMFLYETLRLYSPVIFMKRKSLTDLKLRNLMIPKNTVVAFPFPIIHRNKKYWGEDADEFNPMRFANGLSGAAKHPNAFMAFSLGPKICIGQNFAILEAKTVLAMILQKFTFSLSPNYKHSPVNKVLLQPEFGVPILIGFYQNSS